MKLLLALENVWNLANGKDPDLEALRQKREAHRRKLELERLKKSSKGKVKEENEEQDKDPELDHNPDEPYRYGEDEDEHYENGVLMSGGYTIPYKGGKIAMGRGGVIGFFVSGVGGYINDEHPVLNKDQAYEYWWSLYGDKAQAHHKDQLQWRRGNGLGGTK